MKKLYKATNQEIATIYDMSVGDSYFMRGYVYSWGIRYHVIAIYQNTITPVLTNPNNHLIRIDHQYLSVQWPTWIEYDVFETMT